MIVQRGKQWCVVSEKKGKSGKRKNLGCSPSKRGAHERLAQVEYFKKKKG